MIFSHLHRLSWRCFLLVISKANYARCPPCRVHGHVATSLLQSLDGKSRGSHVISHSRALLSHVRSIARRVRWLLTKLPLASFGRASPVGNVLTAQEKPPVAMDPGFGMLLRRHTEERVADMARGDYSLRGLYISPFSQRNSAISFAVLVTRTMPFYFPRHCRLVACRIRIARGQSTLGLVFRRSVILPWVVEYRHMDSPSNTVRR